MLEYFRKPLYKNRPIHRIYGREKKIKRGEKDSLTFSMANKKHGRRRDNGCRILCPTPGTGFLITPQK